jgi:hypothetical protein
MLFAKKNDVWVVEMKFEKVLKLDIIQATEGFLDDFD